MGIPFGQHSAQKLLCYGLLVAGTFLLFSEVVGAQQNWKQRQLVDIQRRLTETADPGTTAELKAQRSWLESWNPGKMKTEASEDDSLPKKRVEPLLQSAKLLELKSLVSETGKENVLRNVREFAKVHSDDPAVIQFGLHLLDNIPAARKKHLGEIEQLSTLLIKLLSQTDENLAGSDSPDHSVVRQFARYRRARAFSYRELPDVAAVMPIEDQEQLDKQIEDAFEDLVEDAGDDRTEFVLLEIRMLRRSGHFGLALQKLEKFGAAILPKWYLKKRRDLLNELNWKPAYTEAKEIYATRFPDEVAKEAANKN